MIIYVYKFKDGKLDVFEADTKSASRKSDGSFIPSRPGLLKSVNTFIVKFEKCLINNSGKGITRYDSKCSWIICTPGVVFRNILWLPEYNLEKAIECFTKDIDNKIIKHKEDLEELYVARSRIQKAIRSNT